MSELLFAVNGTLMRGLDLNGNIIEVGAKFVQETTTAACYRLWSIHDRYPAMIRDDEKGQAISVEIWRLSAEGLLKILAQEPPGLCLGKVSLKDSSHVLGILGEPYLCVGQREITRFGGWREYLALSSAK